MLTFGDLDRSPYPMAQYDRTLRQIMGDAYYYASAHDCGPQRPRGSRPHVRTPVFDCGCFDAGRIHRCSSRRPANHGFGIHDSSGSPQGDHEARDSDCPGFAGRRDQPADDCPGGVCQPGLLVRPGEQYGREGGCPRLREVPSGQHDDRGDRRLARLALLGLLQPYVPVDDGGCLL